MEQFRKGFSALSDPDPEAAFAGLATLRMLLEHERALLEKTESMLVDEAIMRHRWGWEELAEQLGTSPHDVHQRHRSSHPHLAAPDGH